MKRVGDSFDELLLNQPKQSIGQKSAWEQLSADQTNVISRDSNPVTTVCELVEFLNSQRKLVLCQEKVQIKCNQFSFFVIVNSLSLLGPFPSFSDIVPHIHLETNIHNDYEYVTVL